MSGRIPQHFIDELMARADIIEVIGSRVPLKKGGKEFKACCPFHDEKSASFTVVPDKQFYHCFGCGAHGTVLGFLMEYDHLSFVEAVEELATRVGLPVPREQDPTFKPKPVDDLYKPLERATDLYRQQLTTSDRAINYLKKRGLSSDIAQRFAIGYATDAWDLLLKSLSTSESDVRQLLQVGLIIERDQRGGAKSSGHYDRFRDRIMFPIRDSRGRTIGFGGRILDQGEPKYLNSPETELFHKGRELYGLFEARQATRNITRLMVVEGYMDVVRLHQAGITYAVATLGTATTPEHLKRIFRVCNEVVFCFDGDRAGRAAAWRALENSLAEVREGRQIRFLFLPDGHDPDSLVGAEGREAFEKRLDSALALSDYLIAELSRRTDVATIDGRAQLLDLAYPLLTKIPDAVYGEMLFSQLAKVMGVSADRLRSITNKQFNAAVSAAASNSSNSGSNTYQSPISTGRGSLVRQAIQNLLHFPSAALAVKKLTELTTVNKPGITLLAQLIAELHANPQLTSAALLERWRQRPDFQYLDKLFLKGPQAMDELSAADEVAKAVDRLIAGEFPQERFDELVRRFSLGLLTPEETNELRNLTVKR